MNNEIKDKILEYINSLKERIFQIANDLPEFNMHEELAEIQVLYRIINELKNLINDTADDKDMYEIRDWLKSYSRSV